MSNYGSWKIDDLLTFSVNTHTPSTGAAADADAVPAYRVYEDETATPILTGNMALLDSVNTEGFYSEQITLSAANGFEKGKAYNVYISAAVGGTTGTISHNLQIEAEVDANVVSDKTGYDLAADAVDSTSLANDAITAAKIATDAIGAAELAADAVAEISDGVWEEDIEAAHGTDATAGLLLRALGQNISNETRDANLLDQIRRVVAVVEHQRSAHTHQPIGDIFFVDPTNGNTHASGNRGGISDPYSLIQDCHDNAVTDSNHDLIILLSGASGGATTHTGSGTTTISKRYTFIRGPGRDMICTTDTNSTPTFTITADGVELSGFQINTTGVGNGNGIQVTDADFTRVKECWINATQGDGINILRGENSMIHGNHFTDTGQSGSGQGLHIVGTAGSSNKNHIFDNHFRDCNDDGIFIEDGTTNDTFIERNVIEGSGGYAVNIGASSVDAIVLDNRFGNNTLGSINDGGTTTVDINNVQWAKHSIATEVRLAELDAANIPADLDAVLADTNELQTDDVPGLIAALNDPTSAAIADAVWDEAKAGHTGSTTFGDLATDLDAVLADTNELQTDWVDAGRLDAILDARASQTTADAIETDTQDIQSRLPAALVSGKMDADATAISGSTSAADQLEASALTIVSGTAETGTLSTTQMTSSLTEATDDHYIGRVIIWASGVLQNQATNITDYAGANGLLTFTATTEAPSNNDTFIII